MSDSVNSSSRSAELSRLLTAGAEEQRQVGYADTLREILQQPQTWRGTANLLASPAVSALLAHPYLREWERDALAETEVIEVDEPRIVYRDLLARGR